MAFNDLQLKAMSESAVIAAHANTAKISLFAKSFSELNDKVGASVAVPVYNLSGANDFSANNNYGTTGDEIGGELITLDKHLVKAVGITDVNQAETGIRWGVDTSKALADSITRSFVNYVFNTIESAASDEEEINLTSVANIANLYTIAAEADIPVEKAIVALAPAEFAKVLSFMDSSVYGSSEAVRLGVIEGLYGFKGFVCAPASIAASGYIICDDAVGVATRYVYPGTEGAYPEVWSATTEDGLTLGYRRFMDLNSGTNKVACDLLGGCKVIQPSKIVKLQGV